MRTPTSLWLLLISVVTVPAIAQMPALSPASTNSMRVDPAVQRERDSTRMDILQDELAKESRELATVENEWRNAHASRTSSDKVQEISARVTLHRQNITALEREIGLSKNRPVSTVRRDDLTETPARSLGRQPDDWLIFRPQVPAADQSAVPNVLSRRRLPLQESGNSRPQWIIPSGFTGIGP